MAIEPLFFGAAGRELFGAYEPPRGRALDAGVVVCNAGPHDYGFGHFAVRRLASAIAGAGYHVLRFDWSGLGDSAGDLEDVTAERWIEDVRLAAAELRELSGVRRLSGVGFRLGALLAARASGAVPLRQLVLWDPPVSGAEHLRYLDEAQREQRASTPWVSFAEDELDGFVFTPALRESLRGLDLRRLGPSRADRISIVAHGDAAGYAAVQEVLRDARGRPPALVTVADARPRPGTSFLPSDSIRAIARLLTEVDA